MTPNFLTRIPLTFNLDQWAVTHEGINKSKEIQDTITEEDNKILDLVYESNPDKLEVKQGQLIPVLLKAIQELSAQVEQLKQDSHPCKELHEFNAYPDLIKRIEQLENK